MSGDLYPARIEVWILFLAVWAGLLAGSILGDAWLVPPVVAGVYVLTTHADQAVQPG